MALPSRQANPAHPLWAIQPNHLRHASLVHLDIGDTHVLKVVATQAGTSGTQYVFAKWSDNTTGTSDSIVVPGTATNYTANSKTQFLLTIAAVPSAGGTVAAEGTATEG